MKEGKRVLGIFFVLCCLMGAVPASLFAETNSDYAVGISQKFGRGLLNVVSSPAEIPCGIRDETSLRGAAAIGTGFFKGIAFFLRRVLVGVTEVATFMIPMEPTLPAVCAKGPAAAVQA